MLIIYRTNAGFEGQIQSIDYVTPGPVFDAEMQRAKNPVTDLAYIELDPLTVPAAAHTDLALNPSEYTVDPSGPSLLCSGQAVYPAALLKAGVSISRTSGIAGQPAVSVSWVGAGPISWL
jgi:hypothetical protein